MIESAANSSPTPHPPVRTRNWGLRFSLRGLLVAITILCVALAWRLQRARQQKATVAAIRAAGGTVTYDYQFDLTNYATDPQALPWEPDWLLRLVGVDFFHAVDQVESRKNIARHLPGLPQVRSLLLHNNWPDDNALQHIGRLRSLDTLMIWEADQITDAGAQHLRGLPRLRNVHLGNSALTDRGFAVLAVLPRLEKLAMQQNRLTDVGIAHLARHPRLRSLWIGELHNRSSPLTDAALPPLATITNLAELDLQQTQVTLAGLAPLQRLPLKHLYLSGSRADDLAGAQALFPNCQISARQRPANE